MAIRSSKSTVEGATVPDLESPTFEQMLTKGIQKLVNKKISEKLMHYQDEDEKKLIEEKKQSGPFQRPRTKSKQNREQN